MQYIVLRSSSIQTSAWHPKQGIDIRDRLADPRLADRFRTGGDCVNDLALQEKHGAVEQKTDPSHFVRCIRTRAVLFLPRLYGATSGDRRKNVLRTVFRFFQFQSAIDTVRMVFKHYCDRRILGD
ncbi:hypothetical protein D3C78_1349920 [compost metagenome]